MTQSSTLRLSGSESSKTFMTASEYQTFVEDFYQEVKPILDEQREARIRSEEEAKRHLVA